MGDDSQFAHAGIGYIKIQHDEFKNVLYVPSPAAKGVVQDEQEA